MFSQLLRQLTLWRNHQAAAEGVELFRVLPNQVLENLARTRPQNKAEMIAIKGIKENKFKKYGPELLRIIGTVSVTNNKAGEVNAPAAESLTLSAPQLWGVSDFLDRLNDELARVSARVQGEISSVDERERVIYFTLKDPHDESTMNCFMFRYQYEIMGARLEEGMEVIVEGAAEIYKPYGRLSLRVVMVEPQGEGALKREYDALKAKLEAEGLFAAATKRSLPPDVRRVGLITSRDGAAMGDFMTNLGQFGFKVRLMNSNVEGRRAVTELLAAVAYFKKHPPDVLVIIRGGGSLESLQAFNNETLVRKIKELPFAVICGVGHERDVSLAALASDVMVSTPTAAAQRLNQIWEERLNLMRECETRCIYGFAQMFHRVESLLARRERGLSIRFEDLMDRTADLCHNLIELFEVSLGRAELQLKDAVFRWQTQAVFKWQRDWQTVQDAVKNHQDRLSEQGIVALQVASTRLDFMEKNLVAHDPQTQLRLGYGIVSQTGRSVRGVGDLVVGEEMRVRLWDGEALSQVKSIRKIKR